MGTHISIMPIINVDLKFFRGEHFEDRVALAYFKNKSRAAGTSYAVGPRLGAVKFNENGSFD